MEIKNAVIKSATITNQDHGCLSVWVHVDYGGAGQGFGGYNLGRANPKELSKGGNIGSHFIARCMDVAGVSEWSQMAGKTIRVKGSDSKIEAIGNIINDNWFNPTEDFAD